MKKIFFSTEFTELTKNGQLLSIGFVTEEGEKFYGEISDYNVANMDDWTKRNVLPKMLKEKITELEDKNTEVFYGSKEELAKKVEIWLRTHKSGMEIIQMVADVCQYDWVLFQDLFGGGFEMPMFIYYIPLDLSSILWTKGLVLDINREEFVDHNSTNNKYNALEDALVCKKVYEKLQTIF